MARSGGRIGSHGHDDDLRSEPESLEGRVCNDRNNPRARELSDVCYHPLIGTLRLEVTLQPVGGRRDARPPAPALPPRVGTDETALGHDPRNARARVPPTTVT